MSKAADLARTASASETALSNRNILYNGSMEISQRATSVTGIGASNGYFTLDRWQIQASNTAGRLTMTQTADGPSGFATCLKLDCTTADTSVAAAESLQLTQSLEGFDVQQLKKGTASAEQITISFYVKGNASATYVAEMYDLDSDTHINKTFSVTTSWTRIELTYVGDTSNPFDNNNGGSLQFNIWLHAGSNFTSGTIQYPWGGGNNPGRAAGITSFFDSTNRTFFITGVQMEAGPVATPFEHRSYGQELALCQRYYYVFGGEGGAPNIQGYGKGGDNTFGFTYPSGSMRASPSGATSGTWQKSNCGDPALVHQSSRQFSVRVSVSSQGNYEFYPASGSGKIELSAEL
jgi:hypothetical protein